MESKAATDVDFEERRLKRLKDCNALLQGYPASIKRNLQLVSENESNQSGLRIMQYNILADALAYGSQENFHMVPPECLLWKYRKERLTEQILSLNPDIICLEEVDHFEDFFKPLFSDLGYNCLFFPKKDSPCLQMPDNNGSDGVALLYRKSKLICLDHEENYLENPEKEKSNQPIIVCMLSEKATAQVICIAVTHFKAKKGFEKLRATQANYTLQIVDNIKQKVDKDTSIIICGDFNGVSTEEFYSIFENYEDLKSAYSSATGSEAPFTVWKIRQNIETKQTIDYIWHQPSKMDIISYLAIPNDEDVPDSRFPSFSQPSDHLPLCFDFQLK